MDNPDYRGVPGISRLICLRHHRLRIPRHHQSRLRRQNPRRQHEHRQEGAEEVDAVGAAGLDLAVDGEPPDPQQGLMARRISKIL